MNSRLIRKLLSKSIYFLLLALSMSLVFPPVIRNIIIGLLFISSVSLYVVSRTTQIRYNFLILNGLLFMLYAISLSYTTDLNYGAKKLETSLSLIVFPLIFSIIPLHLVAFIKKNHVKLIGMLIIGVLGLILISVLLQLLDPNVIENNGSLSFILKGLNSYYLLDTLYFSMYVSLGILGAFYVLYHSKNTFVRIIAIISIFILFLVLLHIANKAIITSVLISLGLFSLLAKSKISLILISLVITCLFYFAIYNPSYNEKLANIIEIKNPALVDMNQLEVRREINYCFRDLIPRAGFIGFGLGDSNKELMDCYISSKSNLAILNFNSHNQYYSLLLKIGSFGLISFFTAIIIQLISSIRRENYLSVLFLSFFIVFMLSENVLERQSGVVFFAFIMSLLFSFNQLKLLPQKSTSNFKIKNIK